MNDGADFPQQMFADNFTARVKSEGGINGGRSTCFCCPRVASRVIFVGQSSTETLEHSGGK